MAELILEVVPFGLGVFASPLPVILAILMLFTARPRITSAAYVGTWLAGVSAVTFLFILLAGVLENRDSAPGWLPWVRVALGAALLALAIKQWLGRASKEPPSYLTTIMATTPREATRYGLLMSAANPKELLMALPAGLAIGSSEAGVPAQVAAFVVFLAIGGASVLLPLIVFLIGGGESSLERLSVARDWLQRNNAAVTAVVLGVIGVWLLVGGLLKV